MNMKRLRQEINTLRCEIESRTNGANLVSDRFVIIRNGPEDDSAVADTERLAKAADERAVIIWVVDPPSMTQVTV